MISKGDWVRFDVGHPAPAALRFRGYTGRVIKRLGSLLVVSLRFDRENKEVAFEQTGAFVRVAADRVTLLDDLEVLGLAFKWDAGEDDAGQDSHADSR